mmetsp:Transcript_27289/g.33132  ORF Transcript_27289/g.33132 Transcript_27289/m.33132 type:complete len:494 (+) Transcript_27289:271-1752(+)|eukprot:CAMPEP_0197850820 /NCGR_PEP_ID=MMETSP1438-20131217/16484_1 /TAXON_ID=1461541 /ORGANISM="Pterosperma sp., Strain CCMP1384" /LENGTH=493 /DNA_ID=CAMNT_0043464189 /DNA_START=261 /DNA_END=1742 /DNA_ORIENTATION=-
MANFRMSRRPSQQHFQDDDDVLDLTDSHSNLGSSLRDRYDTSKNGYGNSSRHALIGDDDGSDISDYDLGADEQTHMRGSRKPIQTRGPNMRTFLDHDSPTGGESTPTEFQHRSMPKKRNSALEMAMNEEAELENEEDDFSVSYNPRTNGHTRYGSNQGIGSNGTRSNGRFHDPFSNSHSNPTFEEDDVRSGLTSGMRNGAQESSSNGSPDVLVRRNSQSVSQPYGGPVQLSSRPTSERAAFFMSPAPHDRLFQCYVKREKDSSGMYPQFKLFLQEGNQFLMAARRRKKSKTSNYLISLDEDDLARRGASYFGKLRSNTFGTQYHLFNSGLSSAKAKDDDEERKEIALITYKPTALELKGGPRQMTAVLPFPESMTARLGVQEQRGGEGLLNRWKKQKKGQGVQVMALKNKKPVWDPTTKAHCLDFRGRVTEASVKNFQLVACGSKDENNSRIVLQFGKCGDDVYALDFSHPLTPLQAFGIALSSVDGKWCYSV